MAEPKDVFLDVADNADSAASAIERLSKTIVELEKIASSVSGLPTITNALGSLSSSIQTINTNNLSLLSTNIDKISISIKSLDKIANSFTSLTKVASGIMSIGSTIQALETLPKIGLVLKSVDFSTFGNNILELAKSLEPLRGFTSQSASVINALTKIGDAVGAVNEEDPFTDFAVSIKNLAEALKQLNEVESTIGSTVESLTKIDTVALKLNKLNLKVEGEIDGNSDLVKLTDDVKMLVIALEPLNTIRSSLGSVLGELNRFISTSKNLSSGVNFGTLSNSINQLVTAIIPLNKVERNSLSGISNSLNAIIGTIRNFPRSDALSTFGDKMIDLKVILKSLENVKRGELGFISKDLSLLSRTVVDFKTVSPSDLEKIQQFLLQLVEVISPLGNIELKSLTTFVRNLAKLPEAIENFNKIDQKELDAFITRVRVLTNELGPLETKLTSISSVFRIMPQNLNKLTSLSRGVGKGFGKMSIGMLSVKTILGGAGVVFLLRKLNQALKKSFDLNVRYVETLNLFAVSMGSRTQEAKELADIWTKTLGLDPRTIMDNWGKLNLLLKGFGDGSSQWLDASYNMSKNLTQLGYDLASLYDVDFEVAFTKLKSGISGMARPLREWGLDISNSALKEYALRKGIEKSVGVMTQAEKAQLRYTLLMEKTKEIQGDLARTITTPGNALRLLGQRFLELGRAVGSFITPIVSSAIPVVRAVTDLITDMFKNVTIFINKISGYVPKTVEDFIDNTVDKLVDKIALIPNLLKDTNITEKIRQVLTDFDDISLDTYELEGFVRRINDSLLGLGDSASKEQIKEATQGVLGELVDRLLSIQEEADEATNSMYGLLNGIDKFNVLSTNNAISGTTTIFSDIIDKVDYDFMRDLKPTIDNITTTLKPFFEIIEKAIKSLVWVVDKLGINFETLVDLLVMFISIKVGEFLASLPAKFLMAEDALKSFSKGIAATSKDMSSLNGLLAGLMIWGLIKFFTYLKENWDKLSTTTKLLYSTLFILASAYTAVFVIKKLLNKEFVFFLVSLSKQFIVSVLDIVRVLTFDLIKGLKVAITGLGKLMTQTNMTGISLFLLLSGISLLIFNWKDMSPLQRFISVLLALATAAFTAALAFASLNTAWTIGVGALAIASGIALMITTMKGAKREAEKGLSVGAFASGGFPKTGSAFIAGEKGPEWLGKTGGVTTVVNDTQMSDIMYKAVKDGVLDAMLKKDDNVNIVLDFKGTDNNALARAICNPLVNEMKRQGYVIQKV